MTDNRYSAKHWIKHLDLIQHPEGGYFKETYRAQNNAFTSIYYLLESYSSKKQFSNWHRLRNMEEIWHFHCGNTLLLHYIDNQGKLHTHKLGFDADAQLQAIVPPNCWLSAMVENETDPDVYTLVSCTTYPALEFANFELGDREILSREYPPHEAIIKKLTR